MCKHRLDAATVPRPFVLPYTSSRLLRSRCSRFERACAEDNSSDSSPNLASGSTRIPAILTWFPDPISSADGTTLAWQYPKRSEAETLDWPPDRERLGTNCPALARSMSRLSSPRGCLTTLWAIIAPSSSSNACLCSRGHRAINFCADAKRLPVKQSGYRTSAKSPTTTTESGLEGGVVVVVLLSMD